MYDRALQINPNDETIYAAKGIIYNIYIYF